MNFYKDVISKSPFFRSTVAQKDMGLLEPVTRAAVQAIIADARDMGKTLIVTETYRSKERQRLLYDRKLTKLRTVGCHHYGIAADLGLIRNARYEPDGKYYEFLIDLCKKHGLISGIDWGAPGHRGFVDSGHVQRVIIADQKRLFAGSWYPDDGYSPTRLA